MKKKLMILASAALLASQTTAQPAFARELDWVKAAPQNKSVLVDNEHIRMVDVVVPPGGKEPMHTHPEYIEYVVSPAKLLVTYEGKKPEVWETEAGKAYWGLPEPPHSLENVDSRPWHCLLIELKDKPYEGTHSASVAQPAQERLSAPELHGRVTYRPRGAAPTHPPRQTARARSSASAADQAAPARQASPFAAEDLVRPASSSTVWR
jgi:quercetin dioxygenase-like cupin family protein